MKKRVSKVMILCLLIIPFTYIMGFAAGDFEVGIISNNLTADANGTITVNVKNISGAVKNNIDVSINAAGVFTEDTIKGKIATLNDGATGSVDLTVKPLKTLKSGYYDISVKAGAETTNFKVEIKNNFNPPVIIVKAATSNQGLSAGSLDAINITLKNTGSTAANNLKATLTGLGQSTVYMHQSSNTKEISTLNSNNETTIVFPVRVSSDLSSDNISLGLNVEYYNDIGETVTDTLPIYLSTNYQRELSPEEKNRSMPEFHVDLKTQTLRAGVLSDLTFNVSNFSKYSGKNIYITINDNNIFSDAESRYISEYIILNKDKEKNATLKVKVKEGLKSGFYDLPITLTYQNVHGIEKSIEKTFRLEIKNKKQAPSIVLSGIKTKNGLKPGHDDTLVLYLSNLGDLKAKSITATLQGLSMDTISLNKDLAEKTVEDLAGKKDNFVFYKIKLSDKLEKDNLDLTLDLVYYDEYGNKITSALPVYLDIDNSSNDISNIDFKVTSIPSKVNLKQEFNIKSRITNNTDKVQKNVTVKLDANQGFIYKSRPIIVVKELKPGETKDLKFTLISDSNAMTNNYPLTITVERNDKPEDHIKEYLGIFIDAEGASKSKPKIIIDKYDFDGDVIFAGKEFELKMSFFNTSSTLGIRNAKVSISSDEGAFVPVDSSSSFYIDKIGPKESVEYTMKFKAKSDLSVKTYSITADIEYEDELGNSYDVSKNPYTANEKMSIPVIQELRLDISEIKIDEMLPVGMPYELEIEYFNLGKTELSNLLITTEGNFTVQDGKNFVGNFGAGNNDYYSCTIFPDNEGENKGVVKFEFEDAVGEKHVVEKEIIFQGFMSEPMGGEGDFMPEGEGFDPNADFNPEGGMDMNKPFYKAWWFKVLIGVIILVVIIVIVKKKKAKKREKELDE